VTKWFNANTIAEIVEQELQNCLKHEGDTVDVSKTFYGYKAHEHTSQLFLRAAAAAACKAWYSG
jgi:hypothetical protein